MTADRIAILLEAFSFFLVTLDLFGKERLNELYKRIIANLASIKQVKIYDNFERLVEKKGCFRDLVMVLGILVGAPVVLMLKEYNLITDMWPEYVVVMTIIGTVLLIVFMIIYILDWFVNVTLGSVVRLLYKHKIEGVMLGIGTILFLISKCISFFL